MNERTSRYEAVLVGQLGPQEHVDFLMKAPGFATSRRDESGRLFLTIKGPDKQSLAANLATVRHDCLRRAEAIGVETDLAFSTADNIWLAEVAERTVLGGKLETVLEGEQKGPTKADVVLLVTVESEDVEQCAHFYAASRITVLAVALQMELQGPIRVGTKST